MRKCKICNIEGKDTSLCEVTIQEPYKKVIYHLGNANVTGRSRTKRMIVLPKKFAEKLRVDDNIWVIKDNTFTHLDYVYLFRGGMAFHTKPGNCGRLSYECYISEIPGLFDSGGFDRAVFKIALARECWRRGYGVSLEAWRNLQRVDLNGVIR